jgi:hypothetical protein
MQERRKLSPVGAQFRPGVTEHAARFRHGCRKLRPAKACEFCRLDLPSLRDLPLPSGSTFREHTKDGSAADLESVALPGVRRECILVDPE